ncbi:protein of unknown function DUF359 [Pyrolobus fumarii 1A]|uniref:GTP-dependent dephospho-CoA kinase n=1 Tax=Pyrolobus fumarii (strain DSM 11204 / 1A) TaxID=694429 RepID=G0EF83_PYRF1|nr:GTP-dependent dephospho-CoA kinase family protein [Pyrolobus fumarii]AEM38126.1 protein of unknown function DUF359 [Pyrolobus fumarii 1A]
MHVASPPPGYCLEPSEELREYMRRSKYLAYNTAELSELSKRDDRLAVIGDYTARLMLKHGLHPHIVIIDCLTRRERIECINAPPGYRVVRAWNPRGYISWDSWSVIAEAWERSNPTMILIEGEEDLTAIPAIIEAPDGAVIAYGVPWSGLVVVEADWARAVALHIVNASMLVKCR